MPTRYHEQYHEIELERELLRRADTPPTRGEPRAPNRAFQTPAGGRRGAPAETPLGPTPPKPNERASSHLDLKTPPRVRADSLKTDVPPTPPQLEETRESPGIPARSPRRCAMLILLVLGSSSRW